MCVNQQLQQNQYAVPKPQLYSSESQSNSNKKKSLEYREYRYMSFLGDLNRTDCTKDVLEELCEDDYSDAEEELEPNVDTD